MKKITFTFLTILSYIFAFSQTTYTLKQCIDYALKNNRNIKISANDVKTAHARKTEGQSAYLPQVYAQAKWEDNLKLQTTIIPANAIVPGSPERQVKFGNQYITSFGVEFDQMIFNWSYIKGIMAIKPGYDIAKLKKEKTEEDIVYNTIAAYYNILLLNENEKLVNQSEERINKTLPIVRLQKDKGVIRQIDVDKVQVNYNNVIAQKDILATNKTLALNNLKYAIGMPLDSVIAIDSNYSKEIIDAKNYTDTSNIKNRIELRLQTRNLYLQQILLKRTKANYYPTLAFFGKYGAQAFGNNFSQSFTNWFDFGSIGFKLDIPIFDGLRTSSTVKQAKLDIENIKENIAITEEGFKLQQINATTQMSNSIENLAINQRTLELAKNVLDVTTLQYQKGVVPFSDLLSDDYAYKEAEANYLQSLVKYLNAKLEADKSNNNLNSYKN